MLTSNGGISWHNRNINRNVRLNSVYLDTDYKLYVCGDNGLILFSSDFGVSWEDQPTGAVSSINEIGFFDSNSGAAITEDGQVLLTSLGNLEVGTQNSSIPLTTGVYDHNQQINKSYELYQNFPNPFNPVTQINFTIPEKLFVSLKVYDVLGKEVKTLINGELEKGKHSVSFNGSELSSEIYFYKITAGSYIHQRQILLLK